MTERPTIDQANRMRAVLGLREAFRSWDKDPEWTNMALKSFAPLTDTPALLAACTRAITGVVEKDRVNVIAWVTGAYHGELRQRRLAADGARQITQDIGVENRRRAAETLAALKADPDSGLNKLSQEWAGKPWGSGLGKDYGMRAGGSYDPRETMEKHRIPMGDGE